MIAFIILKAKSLYVLLSAQRQHKFFSLPKVPSNVYHRIRVFVENGRGGISCYLLPGHLSSLKEPKFDRPFDPATVCYLEMLGFLNQCIPAAPQSLAVSVESHLLVASRGQVRRQMNGAAFQRVLIYPFPYHWGLNLVAGGGFQLREHEYDTN